MALRPLWRGTDFHRHVRVFWLDVTRQVDRRDLRRQQLLLPWVHADAIAGQVPARAEFTGLTVGDNDDHLIVDRPGDGIRSRLLVRDHPRPMFPRTVDAYAEIAAMLCDA
jgi:hypothetical protein